MSQSPPPQSPTSFAEWLGLSDAPNWRVARPLGIAVSVAAFLLVLFALVAAVMTLKRSIAGGGDAMAGLGASGLIVALLGAPFLVWSTILKHQTVRFTKEGHMTDRINKAVEQLGAEKTVKSVGKDGSTVEETKPNIEVRIGAILSLERIAQDSTIHDKGRDHVRVMEILCAYVRENAKVGSLGEEADATEFVNPRIDIQIVLDVIKRRDHFQIEVERTKRYRLDMRKVDFRGANLSEGNFRGAILAESRFEFCSLQQGDFSGARFDGSVLNFVGFSGADLTGARMNHCRINKPQPERGGYVMSVNMAKRIGGASFIGADISALDYLPEDRGLTFGTKDTKLSSELEETRKEAMELGMELAKAIRAGRHDEVSTLNDSLSDNPFREWSRYDGRDLATVHLHIELLAKLKLDSWPYQY